MIGYIGPHTAPCMARNITSIDRLVAKPQASENSENSSTAHTNTFTSPKRRDRNPVIGRVIAWHTVNEVITQVDWSWLAARLPAMVGSDTLAMVMSSTCMKVPSDRPIVASARLAGRNSPIAGAALEAMKIFVEAAVVGNQSRDGRSGVRCTRNMMGATTRIEAAFTDERTTNARPRRRGRPS